MKKMIVLIIIGVISCNFIFADDTDKLLSYYDTELIKIGFQANSGLSLTHKGQVTGVQWGVGGMFEEALLSYPSSKSLFESYKGKNLASNILTWGGFGLSLTSAIIPLMGMSETSTPSDFLGDYKLAVGMYLSGIISMIIGGVLMPQSFEDITMSANAYNREKMADYQ